MTTRKSRILWIDYLKAFACILVVIGHLLQSFQKAGIDPYVSVTSFINWFIYLFHMPLFIAISGYLYFKGKQPQNYIDYKKFALKKIINLLVPYFVFYLLFIGINIVFSQSVNNPMGLNELIGIINNPIAPYWYLYALVSIFIFIPLLEKICNNNEKIICTILFLLKLLSFIIKTQIYIIDSIMNFGIYFYIGKFIANKENNKVDNTIQAIGNLILYIIFALVYSYNQVNISFIGEIIRFIFAVLGIIVFVKIFRNVNKSKFLDTIKEYTFQIYLLHTIFAAGIRIILLKLGIDNYFIHFTVGFIFSLYIPVIISIVSNKIKYTNIFFYPIKTIEELKGSKTK